MEALILKEGAHVVIIIIKPYISIYLLACTLFSLTSVVCVSCCYCKIDPRIPGNFDVFQWN